VQILQQQQHVRNKLWQEDNQKMMPIAGKMKSIGLLFICDRRGWYRYMPIEGRLNARKLIVFFEYVLKEIKKDDYLCEKIECNKLWLHLDNHGVHYSHNLNKNVLNNKGNLLFPPTYRPEYNLAQYVFSYLKKIFY
jgi:hypothetical protein